MWSTTQLERGKLVWILTLQIRGKTYRFSTEPIVVTNSDEQTGPGSFQFVSGLEFVEYEDTVGLFDSEVSSREVSLSVLFQQSQADGWAAISDPARDIGNATGELALLLVGDDYIDRRVIVDGFVLEPTHGSKFEPVAFTLAESDWEDTARIPDRTARVTGKTWPKVTAASTGNTLKRDDGADQEFYPWVFGNPGNNPRAGWHGMGSGKMRGTPAVLARIDHTLELNSSHSARLVLAGHETWGDGDITYFHDTHKSYWTATPRHRPDARGRTVTTVDISPDPAHSDEDASYISPGDELWIAWVGRSGIPNKDRTGPMRGAGEIISYLLEHSSLRVDTLRNRAVLQEVDAFLLDMWLNEPRSPFQIIAEDLLPILPLSPQARSRGLGWIFWKWNATKEDAVYNIDTGRIHADRTSPVSVSPLEDVYNEITIDYCFDGSKSKPRRSLTYTWDQDAKTKTEAFNALCFASYTRYGSRPGLRIETQCVEAEATARAILDWKIAYHSSTHRTVSYTLPQKYQMLEVGDVCTVTDPGIGWTDAVCLVAGLVRAPGATNVTFVTVSDFARDGLGI